MKNNLGNYEEVRHLIGNGCLFLSAKKRPVSKIIRSVDKSEYSHIGSLAIINIGGITRIIVVDSNAKGVKPSFFSEVVKKSHKVLILKPNCEQWRIDSALNESLDRAERGIKYDYVNGLKELLNRGVGTNFKIKENDDRDICSDYTRQQKIKQLMVTDEYLKLAYPFPEDSLRYKTEGVKTITIK